MIDKISIIVPVYNVEKYVEKCIESIMSQSYRNLEIIIVNDGSTDRSGEICGCYAKKDDRIIMVHQENQGLSMARNKGIDIATGEYIGFIDSDDWIAVDMYSTLYSNAVEHGADISICNFNCVNKDGDLVLDQNRRHMYEENSLITKTVLENDDKIRYCYKFDTYSVIACNKLYAKKLFDDIRFPKGKIFEDNFITYRLMDKAKKIVVLPDYKYYYLQRSDSMTKQAFSASQFERVEVAIDRYNYITPKYQDLEKICRKNIFYGLLACVNQALDEGLVNEYKEEIEAAVEQVRKYSTYNCGIPQDDQKSFELLFDDIKKYTVATKIGAKRKKKQ